MERQTYTVPETAEMFGVSDQTVRGWIAAGVLRAVQPSGGGGKLLVLADSISAVLSPPVAEPVTS